MRIGVIGLGKMGGNMVRRLQEGGHEAVAFDPDAGAREEAAATGATAVESLAGVTDELTAPRVVWMMVPSGDITSSVLNELLELLQPGDILIDGGNSNFKDSQARYQLLKEREISFLDAGTSGGVWGLKEGYCLMVGGDRGAFEQVEPIFATLAPPDGYAHVGPGGAGHFVKMVHNAIEYGMLEAYGEGFEMMQARDEFNLDLRQISELWNHGSVVRSWLLELAVYAFEADPGLEAIEGYVDDTGEGRWAVLDAIEKNVPAPVITLSLLQRFRSRQDDSFSAKTIAALRNQFGGHAVKGSDS
jgi:6-phosphogluconate dehydrogenase